MEISRTSSSPGNRRYPSASPYLALPCRLDLDRSRCAIWAYLSLKWGRCCEAMRLARATAEERQQKFQFVDDINCEMAMVVRIRKAFLLGAENRRLSGIKDVFSACSRRVLHWGLCRRK